MAGRKLAAYVCRGCGIGERLATARLADIAVREGRATVCREHDVLCSADGVAMIERMRGKSDRMSEAILEGLSQAQRHQLADMLSLVKANLLAFDKPLD